jgi:hypothetical protein
MRRSLFLGFLSFGFAFTSSAQQRPAAPSMAPPVAHAAPAPVATTRVPVSARPVSPHPIGTVSAPKTTANHQKPVQRPTNIIVPPVSSITTTASCSKHFPTLAPSPCAPPIRGGTGAYLGGGYYIPIPYYYADTTAEELPAAPDEQGQQVALNEQSVSAPQQSEEQQYPSAASSRSGSGYLNEKLAEFVFVNRDGTKFNAVAYSFLKDKLQYVTKEGIRHTASFDSLDLDATQKVNEELGNTINLPGVPPSGVAQNVPASTLN